MHQAVAPGTRRYRNCAALECEFPHISISDASPVFAENPIPRTYPDPWPALSWLSASG